MNNLNPAVVIVLLVLIGAGIAAARARVLRKQLQESQRGTLDQMDRTQKEMADLAAKGKEHHEIAKQTLSELQEIKRYLAEMKRTLDERLK